MAQIDASIPLGVRSPQIENQANALVRVLQVQGLQRQNKLADMQFLQAQRNQNEVNALSRVRGDPRYYKNGKFDLTAAEPELYRIAPNKAPGFVKDYYDQRKSAADAGNTEAEMGERQWTLMGKMTNVAAADPRPETVSALLDQWEQVTGQSAGPVRNAFAQAATPEAIREIALRLNLHAKDQLVSFETRNTGGATQTLTRDPVRGTVAVVNSVQNTQSPDSKASTAVLIRGQNMVDARAREANALGRVPSGYRLSPSGQGLEYIPGGPADPARTGEKVPSEGERKAATLLQRLEGSQRQLQAAIKKSPGAASPELTPGAIRGFELPVLGGIPGAEPLANWATSDERQQVEAAQLDMLDAALTLGTGAAYTREQLEGYRKSYFPQLGDSDATVKDKQARLENVIRAARIAAGRAATSPSTQQPTKAPTVTNW